MLSAIVRSGAGPEALGRSLAPLVRGVVEGLVGEVVVLAAPGDADSARVAEASGASLLIAEDWGEGWARAAKLARCDRLLAIEAGVLLPEAFWPDLAERLAAGASAPLATRGAAGPFVRFMSRLGGRPDRGQALVLPRALVDGDPWLKPLRPGLMAAAAHRLTPAGR